MVQRLKDSARFENSCQTANLLALCEINMEFLHASPKPNLTDQNKTAD
jgi:hypothetical protein